MRSSCTSSSSADASDLLHKPGLKGKAYGALDVNEVAGILDLQEDQVWLELLNQGSRVGMERLRPPARGYPQNW